MYTYVYICILPFDRADIELSLSCFWQRYLHSGWLRIWMLSSAGECSPPWRGAISHGFPSWKSMRKRAAPSCHKHMSHVLHEWDLYAWDFFFPVSSTCKEGCAAHERVTSHTDESCRTWVRHVTVERCNSDVTQTQKLKNRRHRRAHEWETDRNIEKEREWKTQRQTEREREREKAVVATQWHPGDTCKFWKWIFPDWIEKCVRDSCFLVLCNLGHANQTKSKDVFIFAKCPGLGVTGQLSCMCLYMCELLGLARARKLKISIKNKKSFRNCSWPRAGDGPCASCWYGPLHVQKLTLLVCNDVKSPGQSFHVWHFLDKIAPSFE